MSTTKKHSPNKPSLPLDKYNESAATVSISIFFFILMMIFEFAIWKDLYTFGASKRLLFYIAVVLVTFMAAKLFHRSSDAIKASKLGQGYSFGLRLSFSCYFAIAGLLIIAAVSDLIKYLFIG